MRRFLLAMALASSTLVLGAEPTTPDQSAAEIKVECYGVLRDGVVAIGGETTGTTISFGRMIWDLSLNDDTKRAFAKEHTKQRVTVTGSVKRVTGTQIPVRWVVDVDQFSIPKETPGKGSVLVTATGKLHTAEGSGDESALFIETKGINWPLDFSKQPPLEAAAQKLLQKNVIVRGEFEKTDTARPSQLLIHVNALEVATETRQK
jgi:hypothetical protein